MRVTAPARDASTPPPGELGQPGHVRPSWNINGGTPRYEVQPGDYNPDLRFPLSVKTYDRMRTDEQVSALLSACTLPILEADWTLDTEGVDQKVVDLVRAEIGLPAPGEPQKRRRRGEAGIVLSEHLREAVQAFVWGFMPFEQVYTVTNPGEPHHPDGWDQPVVHLAKLAPRLPLTVRQVLVGRDGGLDGIVQSPYTPINGGTVATAGYTFDKDVTIPVDRLVMYTLDREGGDWTGRSMLRACVRPWTIKDQLIRIDAQAAERQGMGLPVYQVGETSNTSREEALEVVTRVRSGAESGAVIPSGDTFSIVGVSGGTVDVTSRIQYHDQAITRSGLAMFMDLGHDNGARSLGESFIDVFTQALATRARWIAQIFTEHVIRDLVEWNVGPDEPYPTLTVGSLNPEGALSPDQLKTLADGGLLTPDRDLEAMVRERWSLPAMPEEEEAPEPDPLVPALPDPALPPAGGAPDPVTGLPPVTAPAPIGVPQAAGAPPAGRAKTTVREHTRTVKRPARDLAAYAESLAARVQKLSGGRDE